MTKNLRGGTTLRKEPRSLPADVVLVLGDWLVDEYWVFGVHRSSTASRTGSEHLRALHRPQSAVQTFCGAGRATYFLHQLYKPESGPPSRAVLGLGYWHREDTHTLASLFVPDASPNNLFRLTPSSAPSASSPSPLGIELFNMNDAFNETKSSAERDEIEYTTRIIRVYQSDHNRFTHRRFDWEPPLREVVWGNEGLKRLSRRLQTMLDGRRVRAVVLKDMRKGTVTSEIVKWLAAATPPDAHWYVSSKKWDPAWKDVLPLSRLRLYMVPEVAAQEAIRLKKLSCWLTRSGKPSEDAIRLINSMPGRTKCILPRDFTALVCRVKRNRTECVVQARPNPEPIDIEMGGASILFPAMIACMEHEQLNKLSLKSLTAVALKTTSEWVNFEGRRIREPRSWKPDHIGNNQPISLFGRLRAAFHGKATIEDLGQEKFGGTEVLSWSKEERDWRAALRGTGVVGQPPQREFQLWRSMVEVEGYVCCNPSRRESLRELLQGIQVFSRNRKHHASCMLIAGPGTGKSFLARKLAAAAGLNFVEFNITQLRTKGDVVDCFEQLISIQTHYPDKPLLVFMDEINAHLDGEPIYSTFLTPLEDGTFVHNGRTSTIRPCVWIFAGTQAPKVTSQKRTGGVNQPQTAEKQSDFESRLTLGRFDLSGGKTAGEALERVYLGVSLLKAEFPEVDRISEAVLRAFHILPASIKAREVKHFVRRFEDVQYGQVRARNVPGGWPGDATHAVEERWKGRVGSRGYSDAANIQIIDGEPAQI
jgi:hypothetical protein